MTDAKRFKLTRDSLENRCLPPAVGEVSRTGKPIKQKIYWDTELKGFGVLVGTAGKKSFIVQRDMKGGRTVRHQIGKFPTWTVEQARKQARSKVVDMDTGVDPNAARRAEVEAQRGKDWERFTLNQAIDEHAANMRARGCADRSITDMRIVLERHCSDWLNKPLVAIRRADCIQRHRKLSENSPVAANHVMRAVRACWGSASRLWEELPPHPVKGVVFNKEYRRREPIPWEGLPAWWSKVVGIENAIRRHFHLFTLFTGLRGGDAAKVRWEHINFEKGTIHRPQPKGGRDHAFTVPLPAFVLWLLRERRDGVESNALYFPEGDGGWVFPTRDYDGNVTHLQETKEQRFVDTPDGKRRKVLLLPTSHRNRDTFSTACLESGVGHMETKLLMNHRLPGGDVTLGYMRPSVDHLRGCVERIAEFLMQKAEAWLPLPKTAAVYR